LPEISFLTEETIMKTQQYPKALTFALPQDHFEQIKQITDEKRISIAEWVRGAVETALEQQREEEPMT
jgi:hypothetical protein